MLAEPLKNDMICMCDSINCLGQKKSLQKIKPFDRYRKLKFGMHIPDQGVGYVAKIVPLSLSPRGVSFIVQNIGRSIYRKNSSYLSKKKKKKKIGVNRIDPLLSIEGDEINVGTVSSPVSMEAILKAHQDLT